MSKKKKRNRTPKKTDDSVGKSPGKKKSKAKDTQKLFGTWVNKTPNPVMKRWAWLILLVTLVLMPFTIYGTLNSLKVYSNNVMQWLPSGFQEAKNYQWFKEHFGVDEMIVISWPKCHIDNDDVIFMQRKLEEQTTESGIPVFVRVVSGQSMESRITGAGASVSAARNRLSGLMVGPDGKTTCILAFPDDTTGLRRAEIVDLVYNVALTELEIEKSDLKLGGPTVDGAAIDVESKKSLDQFMWMSVLLVFILTLVRLRDLRLALVVLFFSVGCASLSLAVLYYTGGKMNMTMVMLPTLTFVLGVSGCVHMANYYRKAVNTGHGTLSADIAIRDGFWPVVVSSTTTAIGLVSLATSQVEPIRQFGCYSAIGVILSIPIILLAMPAVLYLFKGRISKQTGHTGKRSKREVLTGVSRTTSVVMNWVIRSHWWVTIPFLFALVTLSIGISHLKASFKLQNRFAERTPIIQDYQWLEENIGPLVPMEVVVTIGDASGLTLWEQMVLVDAIETAIERTTAVNASFSAATFRPPIPKGTSALSRAKRRLIIKEWEENISEFEDSRLVEIGEHKNLWRISLRVDALNDIDYGKFLDAVSENVNHQLDHVGVPETESMLTGGIPLFYKAQEQILADLRMSFLTAFIFITLILILVLRSFRAGLIAMIPNVFPPLVIFGAMGWLGLKIEIGSVMTASVALGIAVDDTIHFLTWYRRATRMGMGRSKAIRYAFDHCAKAMIDTDHDLRIGSCAVSVQRVHAHREIFTTPVDSFDYRFGRRFVVATGDFG